METTAPILACVATISDCQNGDAIGKINTAILGTIENSSVKLLDVTVCPLSSRTIYTFAGHPTLVSESALRLSKVVFENFDFSTYNGNFPCFGALDNCVFLPIRRITLDQCKELSTVFAKTLHETLDVTVYSYATEDFDSLTEILRHKAALKKNEVCKYPPQFVSSRSTSPWGSTLVWATQSFVNYDVLLFSTKEQAHKIALDVRDIGRGPNQAGTLKGCQAIGVWNSRDKIAQLTMTLQGSSSVHSAYEEVLRIATSTNLPLMGSRIVGMVPLKTLLDAAEFYIERDGLFVLEECLKVKLAVTKLGLNAIEPFDPLKKILEYAVPNDQDLLVGKSVTDFVRTVGARVPVPAGGSVAATVAALGAALGCMVGQMTYGRKQWEKFDSQMRRLIPSMHQVMENVMAYVDQDTEAFNQYIAAVKLPKETEQEREKREAALQGAISRTIDVPLNLARDVSKTWSSAEELAHIITEGAISDLRVGAWCLHLAVKAAHSSIHENVKIVKDDKYRTEVLEEIEDLLRTAKKGKKAVVAALARRH